MPDLVNAEFRRLAASGVAVPSSQKGQAEFFGFSPTQYNRLLSGVVQLDESKLRRIVERLRPDEQDANRRNLEVTLRQLAVRAPGRRAETRTSLDNAIMLFERLSGTGSLLCVEYRDLPRTVPESKYPVFAEQAGRAVAKGLHFALFQPFGPSPPDRAEQFHTETVRAYIKLLRDRVREAFTRIRDCARAFADPGEASAVDHRVILYERVAQPFTGSGIQSRMFYAEYRVNAHSRIDREIWEWIAATREDLFVERDLDSTPWQVIAEQFFPVTEFWHRERRLPVNDAELKEALALGRHVGIQLDTSPWSIWSGTDAREHTPTAKRARSSR